MSARPPFVHMSTSYADHHSSSSSSSSSQIPNNHSYASHAPPPYRDYDYPPEKVELDADVDAPRSTRQQYDPSRGSYNARRPPISLETTGGPGGRRPSWRDRFERTEECQQTGRLGKALILGWVITTLGFVAATAFYKGELFSGEPTHTRAGELMADGSTGSIVGRSA